MLYEAYERKILKIKKIRDLILKFKFLILGVLCAILAVITTLSIIKGGVTKEFIPNEQYVYGQEISINKVESLMSKAYCEFSGDGYEGWSTEKPIYPGNYKVRTTGVGSFNIKKSATEYEFTIVKKDLDVFIEDNLAYGSVPKVNVNGLVYSDKYVSNDFVFDYDVKDDFTSTIKIISGDISVLNEKGDSVESAYNYNGFHKAEHVVNLTKGKLTITLKGDNITYNGSPLKNEKYEVKGDLAPWDNLTLTNFAVLDKIGEIENDATISITNEFGKDVSELYDVTIIKEPLIMNKRHIKITLLGKEETYNGNLTLSREEYELDGTLADGEKIFDTDYAVLHGIGEIENDATITIKSGDVVTNDYYDITVVKEKLKLNKRHIKITLLGKEETYNGNLELSREEYKLDGTLAEGETLSVTNYAKLHGIGYINNNASIAISNSSRETTDFYDITLVQEKLTLKKRPITITLLGKEETYNGNLELSREEYLLDGTLAEGETLSVTNYAVLHGIGEIENDATLTIKSGDVVTNEYYDITVVKEKLKLNKRHIKITLLGKEETYNGNLILKREEYLLDGTLAEGETLSVTNYAILHGIGEIENDATITIKRGDVVTNDYYDIEIVREKLIIKDCKITIKFKDGHKVYDGLPLTEKEYEIIVGDVIGSDSLVLSDYASITYVGETPNVATIKVKDGSGEDVTEFYEITVIEGVLKVSQAKITINFISETKTYDGFKLIGEYATIGEIASTDLLTMSELPSLLYVGSVENVSDFTITRNADDEDKGKDVKFCYEITVNKGTLKIDKRSITINFNSYDKVYDGVRLNGEYATIGEVASTDLLTMSELPSLLYVGSVENVSDFTITRNADDEDKGKDVKFCYEITVNKGILTITFRNIEIKFKEAKRQYNGQELIGEYEIIGKVASTDNFNLNHTPSITFYGSTLNYSDFTITRNVNDEDKGKDVLFCYKITVNKDAYLTIDKAPIEIRTFTSTKIYDSIELYNKGYEINWINDYGNTGDTVTVEEWTKIKDVGKVDNVLKLTFKNGEIDSTNSYEIVKITLGYLEITPSPITITAPSYQKVYDGVKVEDLGKPEITSERGLFGDDTLSYSVVVTRSGVEVIEVIDAGEYQTALFGVKIMLKEKDVSSNYSITLEKGEIVIDKRPIAFRLIDKEKPFDGTPLTSSAYEITEGSLAKEQKATLSVSGSITYIGKTDNVINGVIIKDANNKDVTYNYEITTHKGTLEVTLRYIIISPISYSKPYDGTTLSYPSAISKEHLALAKWQNQADEIFGKALYSGCVLEATVKVDSEIINAGSTTSSIVSYDIKCNGVSVLEYYDVKLETATVTIKPRVIEVSSRNVTKVYDGTALVGKVEDCSISKGSLVSGHQIFFIVDSEITEVGSAQNTISNVVIVDGLGNTMGFAQIDDNGEIVNGPSMNYEIRVKHGTLTILEAPPEEQVE